MPILGFLWRRREHRVESKVVRKTATALDRNIEISILAVEFLDGDLSLQKHPQLRRPFGLVLLALFFNRAYRSKEILAPCSYNRVNLNRMRGIGRGVGCKFFFLSEHVVFFPRMFKPDAKHSYDLSRIILREAFCLGRFEPRGAGVH